MGINQNIITTMFQKGNGFSFYITKEEAELGVTKKVNGTKSTHFYGGCRKKGNSFFRGL